jgi:hypothetical protein
MIIFVENTIREVGMAYVLMKKARDNAKNARSKAKTEPDAPAAKGSQPKKVKHVVPKPKELSADWIIGLFKKRPRVNCVKVISSSKKEYLLGKAVGGNVKYKIEGNTIIFNGRVPFLKSNNVEFNLDDLQFARDSAVLNNKIYADMKDGTSIFIDYYL